jgi:hypothetical protein
MYQFKYFNSPSHDSSVSIEIISDSIPILIHLTDKEKHFWLDFIRRYCSLTKV